MITGSTAWTTALNSQAKKPLYLLELVGQNNLFGSFVRSAESVTLPGGKAVLPYMIIPTGASQSIDELEGHSSISSLDVACIDPNGEIKTLALSTALIGTVAKLWMGFPNSAWPADFVTLHQGTVRAVERAAGGAMRFTIGDFLISLVDTIFFNGGPAAWLPGQAKKLFPATAPAIADNGQPISAENPRYLAGNPMVILLAALQNELGVGQASPPVLVVNTQGGSGTGRAGFGVNPAWTFYNGTSDATLINPNPYVDVPGILALRDGQFSGERMEFALTGAESGKSWIESEILKPLGLYWITGADGKLKLKSMKYPATGQVQTPWGMSDRTILDIPEIERWPVINMIDIEIPMAPGGDKKLAMQFVNQDSINLYRSTYVHSLNPVGLSLNWGASLRAYILASRIFARHGFATPVYTIKAQLKNLVLELGDFISLTHPLLLNLKTGTLGVTSILCEVIERQPDYASGGIAFKAIDTRFINVTTPYKIMALATGVPDYPSASPAQKAAYMYIANYPQRQYSDATAGHPIF